MTTPNENPNAHEQYERPIDVAVATIWGLLFVLLIGVSLGSLVISKSMLTSLH